MEKLVCPNCGHDQFTQRRISEINVTVQIYTLLGMEDVSEETIDGGDSDGEFVCDDCSEVYCEDAELITEEAYEEAADDSFRRF